MKLTRFHSVFRSLKKWPGALALLAAFSLVTAEEDAQVDTVAEPGEAPTEETVEAAPKGPVTLRETVNSLGPSQLQEAISVLREHYILPSALTDHELNRAALEGLIHRLKPGVNFVLPRSDDDPPPAPFLFEMLDERIAYLRPGALIPDVLSPLDDALAEAGGKSLAGFILDLRGGSEEETMETAAEILNRFIDQGELMFSIQRGEDEPPTLFTSNAPPAIDGDTLLIVLVDDSTGPGGETVAGGLKTLRQPLFIGDSTPGQAVLFEEKELSTGEILRVAVAKVMYPDDSSLFPQGLDADLRVFMEAAERDKILQAAHEEGVAKLVFEEEPPRRSLAEMRMPQAREEEEDESPKSELRDPVLQRAVDLITTLEQLQPRG